MGIFRNPRGRPRKGQILHETLEESREKAVFQKKVREILKLYEYLVYRDTTAFTENQCITRIFPEYNYEWLEESRDFVQRIPEYLEQMKDTMNFEYLEKLQRLILFWISVRKVIRHLSTLSQTTYISDAERDHAINNDGFLNIEEFRKQLTGGSKMPFDPIYSAWYSKGNPYD